MFVPSLRGNFLLSLESDLCTESERDLHRTAMVSENLISRVLKSYQQLKGNTCPILRQLSKIPILTGELPICRGERMIHLAENQGKIPQAAGNTIPRKKYLSLSGNTSGRRAVSRRGVWFVRSNGRRSVSGTGWRSVAWCGAWFIFSSKAGSSTGSGRGVAWFISSSKAGSRSVSGRGVAWFISSSKAGSRSVSGRGVAWFISSSKAGSPAASGRGGAWLTGSKADAADALSGNTSGRRAVSRRGVWFVRSNGRRSVSGTGWRSVAWCGAWFIFSSKAGSSTGSGRGVAWFISSSKAGSRSVSGRGVAWFISSSKAGSRSVSGRGVAWFISSSKAGSPAASGRGGAWLTGSKADAADALTPRGATFLSLDIRHRGHAFLLLLLGSFFPTSNVPADLHSIFFHDGHDKLLESLDRYLPVDFDKVSDILPSYNYYVSVEDFMTCWQTALDDSTTRLSFYFWLVNKFVFVLETSPVTLLKQGGIEKWYCFRPNKGVVLLTVDASLKGGEGGWGAVLRDHQLRVLDADCGTLYKAANIKIVTIAEAMCILCGIRLAVRYRDPDGRPITKVVGISDSLDVVTDFNKDPSDWDPKYAKIFGYIKYFASLLEEFTLQWAPRETNELANYLAGIGKTGAAVDRSIFTAIAEFDRSGVYFRTRQMKF